MAGTIRIIKDDRKKLDRFLSQVHALNGYTLKVGFIEGDTHNKARDSKGKIISTEPIPVAAIAAVHEFGSEKMKIPERSFIRSWVDANRASIANMFQRITTRIMDDKLTPDMGLKQLGVYVKGGIQRQMRGTFVALKPRTIKRKGSSVPLIDTGQMRASVRFVVSPRNIIKQLAGKA